MIGAAGLALFLKPSRRLRVPTRKRALLVAASGAVIALVALLLPASESRASRAATRLDAIMPVWQFHEIHALDVDASPERVFDAVKRVRADEIRLFHALTWIRRGGRSAPESILNPGNREPLLEIAVKNGFVTLADDAPRELVIGTVVVVPPGTRGGTLTPDVFQRPLPPGFALATMNFLVTPVTPKRSRVSTETRVFATGPEARRRFAVYWRAIYPGSAIIRRLWLEAIARRATDG